jgi:hypothetical protein
MTEHTRRRDTTQQNTDPERSDQYDTDEENPAEENLPWPTQHPHDQHDVMRPDQGQDNT